MNASVLPSWVLPYIIPFFSLSYPTDPPPKTDSFHDSQHFGNGWLDICTIVGLIAAMAILRDLARLCIFEPFAHWKLTKDLRAKKLAASKNGGSWSPSPKAKSVSNGATNGHHVNGGAQEITFSAVEKRRVHRSVLRFAEQGWALLCYSFQCGFGFVSPFSSFRPGLTNRFDLGMTVRPLQFPNKSMVSRRRNLDRLPCFSLSVTGASQVLLPERDRILHPRDIHFDRGGQKEGSCPDDVTPLHRDRSHVTLLLLELYQGWMSHHDPHGHLRCSASGAFPVHICAFSAVVLLLLSDPRVTT